jgi:hypothetical protein
MLGQRKGSSMNLRGRVGDLLPVFLVLALGWVLPEIDAAAARFVEAGL